MGEEALAPGAAVTRSDARRAGDGHAVSARRADIQGLRALAVTLVVAYHAGLPVPGGFIGVDMFFVISGFVITGMLLNQLDRSSGLRFGSFYSRRMRRLLPALALLTTFTAAASVALLSPLGPQQATAKTGLAASLFSANLQLAQSGGGGYFDLSTETNAMLHTWSLSVEEQFYLVFPAFLIGAWTVAHRYSTKRGSSRRMTLALVLTACVASFAVSCYMTYSPSSELVAKLAFYSPLTRAWEFGAGVVLALSTSSLLRLTRKFSRVLGALGVLVLAIGVMTITPATPFPGYAALIPVLGTALLLVAGLGASGGVSAALGARSAVWVGDVSYGWYLWHWPLIVFAAAMWPGNDWVLVVVAVASLAPTWLSYRFVENPIRFNDRLTGRRVVPLVIACVAVPVLACLALLATNRILNDSEPVQSIAAATRLHADHERGCDQGVPIGEATPAECTWSVPDPRGTIVLIGDSNAGHFTEPIAEAANDLGYDLTVAVYTGCPFTDLIRMDWVEGRQCHRFVTDSVTALIAMDPALVVIASSGSFNVNSDGVRLRDPHTGELADTIDERTQMWELGLSAVLSRLSGAGIPTVVVHTVPHFGDIQEDWVLARCPTITMFAGTCGTSIDRDEVDRQQRRAREAERRATIDVPAATTVDFTEDICSAATCSSEHDDLVLYNDAIHLSVDGALTLTERFRELIDDKVPPQR